MRRLTAAGLLPERAGRPVKAWVHISLADLLLIDGDSALQEQWTAQIRERWAAHPGPEPGRHHHRVEQGQDQGAPQPRASRPGRVRARPADRTAVIKNTVTRPHHTSHTSHRR